MELQEAINHAREVAEKCPADSGFRLTDRDCAYQHDQLADWLEELKSLKSVLGDEYDLEELREMVQAKREGRCLVLPCKIGDPVWRIVHDATPHVTKDRCTDIKYENGDIWVHLIGDRVMGGWNFGKLLFLTHAEAEEALRREQDENR